MGTNYQYWEKLDVDKVLKDTEQQEKKQEVKEFRRNQLEKEHQLNELELEKVKTYTEVLKSHEAVKLLKSKSSLIGRRNKKKEPSTTESPQLFPSEDHINDINIAILPCVTIAENFNKLADQVNDIMQEVEHLQLMTEVKSRHATGYLKALKLLDRIGKFSMTKLVHILSFKQSNMIENETFSQKLSNVIKEINKAEGFVRKQTCKYLSSFSLTAGEYALAADMSRFVLKQTLDEQSTGSKGQSNRPLRYDNDVGLWITRAYAFAGMGVPYLIKLHLMSAKNCNPLYPGLDNEQLFKYLDNIELVEAKRAFRSSFEDGIKREVIALMSRYLTDRSTVLKSNPDSTSVSIEDIEGLLQHYRLPTQSIHPSIHPDPTDCSYTDKGMTRLFFDTLSKPAELLDWTGNPSIHLADEADYEVDHEIQDDIGSNPSSPLSQWKVSLDDSLFDLEKALVDCLSALPSDPISFLRTLDTTISRIHQYEDILSQTNQSNDNIPPKKEISYSLMNCFTKSLQIYYDFQSKSHDNNSKHPSIRKKIEQNKLFELYQKFQQMETLTKSIPSSTSAVAASDRFLTWMVLDLSRVLHYEAQMLFLENFYQSSGIKYAVIILLLQNYLISWTSSPVDLDKKYFLYGKQLLSNCYINLANCRLLQKKNIQKRKGSMRMKGSPLDMIDGWELQRMSVIELMDEAKYWNDSIAVRVKRLNILETLQMFHEALDEVNQLEIKVLDLNRYEEDCRCDSGGGSVIAEYGLNETFSQICFINFFLPWINLPKDWEPDESWQKTLWWEKNKQLLTSWLNKEDDGDINLIRRNMVVTEMDVPPSVWISYINKVKLKLIQLQLKFR